jgi:RNA polymerase sigma-70 factor (ECF subfamily)
MAEIAASALAELPFDLRSAFVLCDLEEMSGADAAAALDVRPGTLGRRLFEARRALRAAVEEVRQ